MRRHGVHLGRLPPDGQSRAVHLQDHRLRRDVEARSPATCRQASAVVRARGRGESEQARECCSPAPATRFFYSTRRRRALDRAADRPAARAGHLGRRAEAVPRRRGFDVRPRALHSRRHHAAGADGQRRGSERRCHLFAPRRPYRWSARPRVCELSAEESAQAAGAGCRSSMPTAKSSASLASDRHTPVSTASRGICTTIRRS